MNYSFLRRILFSMKPETAHRVVMANLDWVVHVGLHKKWVDDIVDDPVYAMGLRFPNAVGLAAGMSSDGRCVSSLGGLGLGFVEVGTVTPTEGKPTAEPRRFRLLPIDGYIHRNCGKTVDCETMLANLRCADPFRLRGGIVGINIGHNVRTRANAVLEDIETALEKVYDAADYIVLSSASLRAAEDLEHFIKGVAHKREDLALRSSKRVPLLAKLSPDTDDETLVKTVTLLIQYGFDGVVATSSSEKILEDIHGMAHSLEEGEVSGSPLFERALQVVRLVRSTAGDKLCIIASGGIMSGIDAVDMLNAGAKLVQLHTGLIYRGPALIPECSNEIAQWRFQIEKR